MIELSFETLASGGVVEALHEEMKRVIDNCLDPNTEPSKVRKLKLEMKIKPNEHRDMAVVEVTTAATMCPAKPIITDIYMGKNLKTGQIHASEVVRGENPHQHSFPDTLTKGEMLNQQTGEVLGYTPAKVSNLQQ